MRLAYIRGYATATVKHASFNGQRLLIAQPVDETGKADGSPQLVLDPIGAGLHEKVIICSDGSWAREYLKDPRSPARWWVMGIVDPEGSAAA
jgi:microcompartment protein CcmK/EutM